MRLFDAGVDQYASKATRADIPTRPPTDLSATRYGRELVLGTVRASGSFLMEGGIRSMSALAERLDVARALVETAFSCRTLADGTPPPLATGMIEVLVGTVYDKETVPTAPQCILVVRPTSNVPGMKTGLQRPFAVTSDRRQSMFTYFAQAWSGDERDYSVPIGAILSPVEEDVTERPLDDALAIALDRPASHIAQHAAYVASRMDVHRGPKDVDPAWLFSASRVALDDPVDHSMTAAAMLSLADEPGFGRVMRDALGPDRVLVIHVCDEEAGGTGLHRKLRYRPAGSKQLLTGEMLEESLGDPRNKFHRSLAGSVWAWAPDLPDGVPTLVMSGEFVDVRTQERFVPIVLTKGYNKTFLAMPYVDGERPVLDEYATLRLALAVRTWAGDSPYFGPARRRTATYHERVNMPLNDASVRVGAYFSGAASSLEEIFPARARP
jgi:hypothetical protein